MMDYTAYVKWAVKKKGLNADHALKAVEGQ